MCGLHNMVMVHIITRENQFQKSFIFCIANHCSFGGQVQSERPCLSVTRSGQQHCSIELYITGSNFLAPHKNEKDHPNKRFFEGGSQQVGCGAGTQIIKVKNPKVSKSVVLMKRLLISQLPLKLFDIFYSLNV